MALVATIVLVAPETQTLAGTGSCAPWQPWGLLAKDRNLVPGGRTGSGLGTETWDPPWPRVEGSQMPVAGLWEYFCVRCHTVRNRTAV